MDNIKKRINYIDVCKGILIILVVIGHATGQYNKYIYQFHMAAFFFVSGYLSKLEKDSFLDFLFKKIMNILVPTLFIFLLMRLFIETINVLGTYDILFPENLPYYSFLNGVINLFLRQRIMLWLLGAAWFIFVLFYVEILHKIIFDVTKKKYFIRLSISVFLYLIGHYYVHEGIQLVWNMDLILIAQIYYFMGILVKNYLEKQKIHIGKVHSIIFTFLAISFGLLLFKFSKFSWAAVDYPSRTFGNPLYNFMTAMNGTFFIVSVSIVISRIKKVSNFFILFGKRTLAILSFHFLFFKVSFYILYLMGIIDISYLKNFIPNEEVYQYTFLTVSISLILCVILWEILKKIPGLKVLMGEDKEKRNEILNSIKSSHLYKSFVKSMEQQRNYMELKRIWIKEQLNKKNFYIKKWVTLIILISIPIYKQIIILNDEVESFYHRSQGITYFTRYNIINEINVGRPARIMAAIDLLFSFIFKSIYLSRAIQVMIIIMAIILFSYFVYILFGNKKFSSFVALISFTFLPITFEHCPPNAFNGLVIIPFMELIGAFILYKKYLENKKKSTLYVSGILFFIACLGYEFIILYGLIFPMMFFLNQKKRNIKEVIVKNKIFIAILLIYILIFIIGKIYIKEGYEGAQFGFVSVRESMKIITTLIKIGIPGYYIFNKNYFWILRDLLLHLTKEQLFIAFIRTGVTTGIFYMLLYTIIKNDSIAFLDSKERRKNHLKYILILIIYLILPVIPNSMAKLYQGNVNENQFAGLPVTWYLFFTMILLLSYILWFGFLKHLKSHHVLFAIALLPFIIMVQFMNDIFSTEQYYNYERLETIADFLKTDDIKKYDGQTVFSPYFFVTKHTLAVRDDYWNRVANLQGLNINFIKENTGENFPNISMYIDEENRISINSENEISIMAKQKIDRGEPIRIGEELAIVLPYVEEKKDNGFFCYTLNKIDPEYNELVNRIKFELGESDTTDKFIIMKIEGDYSRQDQFVGQEVQFRVKTGKSGKVKIKGFIPTALKGNEVISIVYNERKINYNITEQNFCVPLEYNPNEIVDIRIDTNWRLKTDNGDLRKLSFVLQEIGEE